MLKRGGSAYKRCTALPKELRSRVVCRLPSAGQREWVAVAVLEWRSRRPTRSRRRTRRSLGCPRGASGRRRGAHGRLREAAAARRRRRPGRGARRLRRAAGEQDHCRQGTMGVGTPGARGRRHRHGREAVWKSKFYGAFVLNRRVVLHAIDATPTRWRGDAGSSPLDRARTAASSPRNLVKNCRVHPTHWLISTQARSPRGSTRRRRRFSRSARSGGSRRSRRRA